MHAQQRIPQEISASETVCFYKKGDWRDGEKWRPIALSNSLYRAIARWIYSILVTIITPLITAWQFGGLKGRTTASSTFQLLEHVAETPGPKSLGMVDFFHAFDSPPKRLLIRALALAGTPQVLLLMILSVYVWAQTKIRGSYTKRLLGLLKG